jgi:hypothetical protein
MRRKLSAKRAELALRQHWSADIRQELEGKMLKL